MEYDIRDTIASLVRGTGPDFDHHMQEQAQRLRLLKCVNPFYGRWVEVGVEFLCSALELEDHDFAVGLPALADLTKAERGEFLNRLQEHLRACRHCSLKHEYEKNLNARIERVLQEHRGYLLQQLRERPISDNQSQ